MEFYVANIGDNDVILGTDWLKKYNLDINWAKGTMDLTRCPKSCEVKEGPVINVESTATTEQRGKKIAGS